MSLAQQIASYEADILELRTDMVLHGATPAAQRTVQRLEKKLAALKKKNR
jgi:hypothetical protein